MSACRETANIWFWMRKGWLFRRGELRRILRSNYFWQDSFLTQFNRLLGCRLFGHRAIKDISDPHQPVEELFCFSCYRHVGG
jgi:hypothetical protein